MKWTIRREGSSQDENPQRPDARDFSMKLSSEWVVGFVDGEGCFHVGISTHKEMTAGYQVLPEFTVVQHKRDVQLLHALRAFFGCGVVRKNHGDRMAFRVRSKKDMHERILPFFIKYPLKSVKKDDFDSFRRVLKLMEENEHLTVAGIQKIRVIAARMNRGKLS